MSIEKVSGKHGTAMIGEAANSRPTTPRYLITLYSPLGTPTREASATSREDARKVAERLVKTGR